MAKVITLSRQFPHNHPKAGQPTYFVERVWDSIGRSLDTAIAYVKIVNDLHVGDHFPKHHTVRLGRRWKDGDMASLRVWSERPYNSPQIRICEDVKLRVVDIWIDRYWGNVQFADGTILCQLDSHDERLVLVASNDGLSPRDFIDWFLKPFKIGMPSVIEAQILIWGDVKEY